ncbi:MAG: hypothetical protein ACRDK5_04835 [Solirubrobacterales bacterium]
MSPCPRAAAALLALTLAVSGCGEEDEEAIGEDSLRNCLADAGLKRQAEGTTPNAPLFNLPTDIRLKVRDGGSAGFVVEGSEEKVQRRAADIRAALRTFGVADPDQRLVVRGNVIAVFDRVPSAETRRTVESCM